MVPHLLEKENGICSGHKELRVLIEKVAQRKPTIRGFFSKNYFTDGKTIMFEYPRLTPDGEQMDSIKGDAMKKVCLILSIYLMLNAPVFAENECFIAKENQTIIQQEGSCSVRHSPCSTFKIAISLMGYNEGILIDATHPEYPYEKGYIDHFGPFPMDAWKQAQNPTTWIQNSCIWYSQIVTQKIGEEKFKRYVQAFNYGNQDVSGDPGKNNGLTESWLSSSLQIAPEEQIQFIEKLVNSKLPVSLRAQEQTRQLFYLETFSNGWKLFGKTGSGFQLNADGTQDFSHQIGWFVGWVEKDGKTMVFAQFMADKEKMDTTAGKRNKEIAKDKLMKLLSNSSLKGA